MLSSCNNRNYNNGLLPLQQHHQQSLPPEQQHQQEQQQINNYSSATYPEAQTYEGWPGMALKQIMGQIDLFNFQNPNYGVNPKWQLNKDFITNHSNGGYMPQCAERLPINTPQQQQQQQHHQQPHHFKTNNFESGHQDNDNALAWLGPQLWNRRIGVDISNDGGSNQSTSSTQSSSTYDAKIKTETSDGDSVGWYNNSNSNNSNSNINNSISNNSLDEKMSESSADISEKDSFSKDEEDFSPADLALVTIIYILGVVHK